MDAVASVILICHGLERTCVPTIHGLWFIGQTLFAATLAPARASAWSEVAPEAVDPLYASDDASADNGPSFRSASAGLSLAVVRHLTSVPNVTRSLFAAGIATDRIANERLSFLTTAERRGA